MAITGEITGVHKRVTQEEAGSVIRGLRAFSGNMAGFCYMSDSGEKLHTEPVEASTKRFASTGEKGHHSIADHGMITVELMGVPKFLVMHLNNLGWYNTSEKSGRYTVMNPQTALEAELYEKWRVKVKEAVLRTDPEFDVKAAEKIGNENAREMLSVFVPTNLSFSTTLRFWAYIIQWLKGYNYSWCEDMPLNLGEKMKEELHSSITELIGVLEDLGLATGELTDYKHRNPAFVNPKMVKSCKGYVDTNVEWASLGCEVEVFDCAYSAVYSVSFVSLAQLQRHRTLHYTMAFNDMRRVKLTEWANDMESIDFRLASLYFHIPELLDKSERKEWISDMSKLVLEGITPSGLKVAVNERGNLEDFKLKAEERLCGRAQHETMRNVYGMTQALYLALWEQLYDDEVNDYAWELIQELVDPLDNGHCVPKSKCHILGVCKEPCVWGVSGYHDRPW